jgi:hypothetical protein
MNDDDVDQQIDFSFLNYQHDLLLNDDVLSHSITDATSDRRPPHGYSPGPNALLRRRLNVIVSKDSCRSE